MAADDAHWPRSLVLLGAGKMGGALLRGWLAQGLDPACIRVVDPNLSDVMAAVCESYGVNKGPLAGPPDALVLAIKPQTFSSHPGTFAGLAGPDTTVVSILAGQTLANLRAGLPNAGAIVRAMPNLPASVGRGMTSLAGERDLLESHRAIAQTLLSAVGQVEWLDEALIDAVTAVSGSGPAYVFLLAECLAEAGEEAGLPRDVAARLARATVEGAGELMAAQPGTSPAALREAVTSPGGTTAAALDILRAPDGLAPLLVKAVAAAKKRAKDLAG
jgi:pyrroline-5-carboxylate reductase